MMNRRLRSEAVSALAAIGLIAVTSWLSCHGDGVGLTAVGDPQGASGFSAQIQPIFNSNCVRCHAPGGLGYIQTGGTQNDGLDLSRGDSYDSLVRQLTHQLPETAPQWRVLPGDADASYVVQKIVSGAPKFGKRMPFDGPPYLSQAEIQLIRNWIEQGAPND